MMKDCFDDCMWIVVENRRRMRLTFFLVDTTSSTDDEQQQQQWDLRRKNIFLQGFWEKEIMDMKEELVRYTKMMNGFHVAI